MQRFVLNTYMEKFINKLRPVVAKIRSRLRHYVTGIVLLALLTFASCTSGSEFNKVKAWAISAFYTSKENTDQLNQTQQQIDAAQAQIDRTASKVGALESKIRTQEAVIAQLKKEPQKAKPPKSYPKPSSKKEEPKKKNWFQKIFD